jgi:hypothetical protein
MGEQLVVDHQHIRLRADLLRSAKQTRKQRPQENRACGLFHFVLRVGRK